MTDTGTLPAYEDMFLSEEEKEAQRPWNYDRCYYFLPYGREYDNWNPLEPETHTFGEKYCAGASVYVLQKLGSKRPTREVISGGGGLYKAWRIGSIHKLYHDQTGAGIGTYEVVGIVIYDENAEVLVRAGKVDGRFAQATFK